VAALHLQHNLSDIMFNTAAEKTPPLLLLPSRLNVNIMSTKPFHKRFPCIALNIQLRADPSITSVNVIINANC